MSFFVVIYVTEHTLKLSNTLWKYDVVEVLFEALRDDLLLKYLLNSVFEEWPLSCVKIILFYSIIWKE